MIGEQEVFVAYISKGDYEALKEKKIPFNMILRRCGGMPIKQFDRSRYCAAIAFTRNLYREDFARELRDKLNVYAAIDLRQAFVDKKSLPPAAHEGGHDFFELMRRSKEQAEMERLKDGTYGKEYSYPSGKQIPIEHDGSH